MSAARGDIGPGAYDPMDERARPAAAPWWRQRAIWQRVLFFGLTAATSASGTMVMADIVIANGVAFASVSIAVLFAITFSHVAAAFWTAAVGFAIRRFAANPAQFVCPLVEPDADALPLRTAVVMPVYNEPTREVVARLGAVHASLAALPHAGRFEIHLLSDTTNAPIAQAELDAVERLNASIQLSASNTLLGAPAPSIESETAQRASQLGPVHYRRRTDTVDKKVGNLAEFCRTHGDRFDAMLVLDADSVMSGTTIHRLAGLMAANPKAGIIQALATPVNQSTLFARMMQFSARINAPMMCTGASFWQHSEGNYFGHNAIIRLAPFIEHCNLPTLSGSGPLSGPILSHDFVEAAFMRRAGYQVWDLPCGEGSFEELPSNVFDYARRDRRWCQGNLQHLRLLTEPGLHPVSRLHLLFGALAFIVSPLWLCLLAFGLGQLVNQALAGIPQLTPDQPLFTPWPVLRTDEALALFGLTIAMLLVPKALGLLDAILNRHTRATFGGAWRLIGSGLLEIVFSIMLAPVLMVYHALFVLLICAGGRVNWGSQPRGTREVGVREATSQHTAQLAVGVTVLAVVLGFVPGHLVWVAPSVTGLLLSVPLSVFSARASIGGWLKRHRWLSTPEELSEPRELAACRAENSG